MPPSTLLWWASRLGGIEAPRRARPRPDHLLTFARRGPDPAAFGTDVLVNDLRAVGASVAKARPHGSGVSSWSKAMRTAYLQAVELRRSFPCRRQTTEAAPEGRRGGLVSTKRLARQCRCGGRGRHSLLGGHDFLGDKSARARSV
jgi:hypothetical protein